MCSFPANILSQRLVLESDAIIKGKFYFLCNDIFLVSLSLFRWWEDLKDTGERSNSKAWLHLASRAKLLSTRRFTTWSIWIPQVMYQTQLASRWRCFRFFRDRHWQTKKPSEKLAIYGNSSGRGCTNKEKNQTKGRRQTKTRVVWWLSVRQKNKSREGKGGTTSFTCICDVRKRRNDLINYVIFIRYSEASSNCASAFKESQSIKTSFGCNEISYKESSWIAKKRYLQRQKWYRSHHQIRALVQINLKGKQAVESATKNVTPVLKEDNRPFISQPKVKHSTDQKSPVMLRKEATRIIKKTEPKEPVEKEEQERGRCWACGRKNWQFN